MRKSSNTLSDVDAAYIAGLIDGEGTIALTRRHRNENRQLQISISNTERPMLDYVISTIGAGKITRKRTYKPNHTPSFTYTISNRQALSLLSQVTPYLKTYKRNRADLILKNYLKVTPRNGYYTSELLEARRDFEHLVMSCVP